MEQAPQDPDPRCQHCGTALTDETTGGLCPRCLLEMSFASRTMPGGEPSPQIPAPTPEEMAARFPQFEILECLGRGGMGIVYKARQKTLDRLVAIKVLAGERHDDPQFEARFSREARTLAKMSHSNIVTVFDHGETEGLFYIVMEYVDGVNLRDLLREGKIEPEQALAIVPPICDALEYAHVKGVVHRDIKPENLLLDRDGRVKIADFGIASLVGAPGEKSGTPPYMAPEQEMGVVDRRADIYALGAVLYEMLTGERPDKDLVAPSKRVEIDVRLDEIVLRALEKEPARRYQTAGEFRTVVQTLAAKAPTEEPPSSREVRPPAAAPMQAARFSRNAIVGVCWVPLFFIAVVPMLIGSSVPAGQAHGPAWWQYLLMFTLLPLGLAAPLGTTILGGVALTQIRRSAGKLYGLGLALFDVLLFPLLAFNALIGGFWLLLFRAFASSSGSYFQPTPVNVFLATLVTAIIVDVLIVRWAWRAANRPVGDPVTGSTAPTTTPPAQRRMKFAVIIGGIVAVGIALVILLPQIDSPPRKAQATSTPVPVDARSPQEVARDFMAASHAGEVERALSMIGGPLGQTPEENARRIQAIGEEGNETVDFGEWHEEGTYAITSFAPPGGRHVTALLILERIRRTWMVVGIGTHRPGVSLEDELRAFKKFRSVNREDRDEVAAAFVRAVKTGDFAQAAMLVSRPMPIVSPSQLASNLSKVDWGSPRADLTAPLSWYQEGPYAVTRVAFVADQPELLSYLVLRQTEGIWRVVWSDGIDPNASLADALQRFKQEQMVASVMVEDLALRFLVAIREKDEKTLRELSVDRTEGWTEALVGHFAMEARERFRQLTGEEFTMYPHPSKVRVSKDLAVVTCHAFRETQKKLNGNVLVLHFNRTEEGWKVWTARNAPESQAIEEHLEQARKWAAEWETNPEHVARNFMTAIRDGDFDAATKWMSPDLKAHVGSLEIFKGGSERLNEAYAGKLDLLTEFTEWYPQNHDANTHFVGTRIAGVAADDGSGRLHGLYLILSPTPEGWKVAHLDDAYSDKPLSHYVDRIRVQRLPVTPPDAMPDDSPLSVEQLKQVLEGVTWRKFIMAFADQGRGNEISWKQVESKGEEGHRFEIGFPLGGERMLLDLMVDPEFQHAVPSRLRPSRSPDQVVDEVTEFLPAMVMRYALRSGHPAAAPAWEKAMAQARQGAVRHTMSVYASAVGTYYLDAGSLPPNLEALLEHKGKKFIAELHLMENHATGNREIPLYHGGPNPQVKPSKYIILAAPSANSEGKRIVGFLDGSVKVIDDEEYQKQLEQQQKPPMERAVDTFLESCARKGITDHKQLFDELGIGEFIAQYGDGERAMREHHDKLPEVMRFAIIKTTGDPSPAFAGYLRGVHRGSDPRLGKPAGLLLEMLGFPPANGGDP